MRVRVVFARACIYFLLSLYCFIQKYIDMCTKPLVIRNNSEYVDLSSAQYGYVVPCGHCADCRKDTKESFMLRAHQEFQEAVDLGGFVLFDTLTYNDDHLPETFGLKHFRYSDFRNFMKRVRSDIQNDGYGVDNLRFLMTSEYGGVTHRPHYHVLFFVRTDQITPRYLDTLINKHWRFWSDGCSHYDPAWRITTNLHVYKGGIGFTDMRLPEVRTILKSSFDKDSTFDERNLIAYVSQYTVKDDNFGETQKKIIKNIFNDCDRLTTNKIIDNDYSDDFLSFEDLCPNGQYTLHFDKIDYKTVDFSSKKSMLSEYKKLKDRYHDMLPHRQCSLHFGEGLLDKFDADDISNDRQFYLVGDDKLRTYINTPIYYQRKLFYDLDKQYQFQLKHLDGTSETVWLSYNDIPDHGSDELKLILNNGESTFYWSKVETPKGFKVITGLKNPATNRPWRSMLRYRWISNDLGKYFKSLTFTHKVDRLANFYSDLVNNLSNSEIHSFDCSRFGIIGITSIKLLMRDRYRDLALYNLCFRGRFFTNEVWNKYKDDPVGLLLYSHDANLHHETLVPNFFTTDIYRDTSYAEKLKDCHLCNDTWHENWKDFDRLNAFFDMILFKRGLYRDKKALEWQQMKSKYKLFKCS